MTPREAAQAAAEAVRTLNLISSGAASGYAYPSDVYDVIGSLAILAGRLPQALRLAGAWLAAEHEAGRVGHDHGLHVLPADMAGVLARLDEAMAHAEALRLALSLAHAHTAPLTGTGR